MKKTAVHRAPIRAGQIIGAALLLVLGGCAADLGYDGEGDDPVTGTSLDGHSAPRWTLPSDVRARGESQYLPYEPAGPWNGGRRCSGTFHSGARRLGDYLVAHFDGARYYQGYACRRNTADGSQMSMHGSGRAIDVFVPHNGAVEGDAVANWLVTHATEIGVQFVIWNRTKWNASYSGRKDAPYGGTNAHVDHLHVELTNDGAQGRTPWFTRGGTPPGAGPLECEHHSGPFAWKCNGPVEGMSCTQIFEGADPHTWTDNYFCAEGDIGMRWSPSGPIDGMRCYQIHEGSDPHTWDDNYLCLPPGSPYHFSWWTAGPPDEIPPGVGCLPWDEPADPDTWDNNYLCWLRDCVEVNGPFAWSCRGNLEPWLDGDWSCTQIHEGSDPHTWTDNYFCTDGAMGVRWSSAGPIDGMRCTQIHEGSDPHTWDDNYLCVPPGFPYDFGWTSAGRPSRDCMAWFEPADPDTWHNNYLCWSRR